MFLLINIFNYQIIKRTSFIYTYIYIPSLGFYYGLEIYNLCNENLNKKDLFFHDFFSIKYIYHAIIYNLLLFYYYYYYVSFVQYLYAYKLKLALSTKIIGKEA